MAVFDGRAVEERAPQDFYEWAQEIAEYMWQAYQRDLQALNDEHGSSGSSSSASEANNPDEVQAAHDPDEVQAEVPEALVNAQGPDQGRDVQPVDQVEHLWAEGMNVIYLRQGREAFQRLREGLRPQRTGVQISARRTIPTILNGDEDVAHVGRAGEAPTLMTVEEWVESVLRGWVRGLTVMASHRGRLQPMLEVHRQFCQRGYSMQCRCGLEVRTTRSSTRSTERRREMGPNLKRNRRDMAEDEVAVAPQREVGQVEHTTVRTWMAPPCC